MSNVAYADFTAKSAVRSNRMENQKTGFIPLYRSVLKKPWAKDVYLRTLWENLLFAAAHQPYTAQFKGRQWELQTGQLVTTSADLGLNLCDRNGKPVSRDAIDRMLDVFEREGMISRVGERRKGTVITITNYGDYAQKIDSLPAQFPAQFPAHNSAHSEASAGAGLSGDAAQLAAHNAAQLSAHHEQQLLTTIKNKTSTSENSVESSDSAKNKPPVIRPDAAIQSGSKWGNSEDLRCAEWLFKVLQGIAPTAKKPNYATWANDVRLMRERDHRTHREIAVLFQWACEDSFWKGNVLCPATLREKWTQLDIKRAKLVGGATAGKPAIDLNNTDWIYGVLE